jgi:hypothetical protein
MTLVATCHCGATRIELPGRPLESKECNCTYCHRTGAVWGYYRPGDVRIVSAAHDAVYAPNGMNQHHFCAHCGSNTYGASPDWASLYNNDGTPKDGTTPGSMPATQILGVNLRMIDELDLSTLDITKVDGRNSW